MKDVHLDQADGMAKTLGLDAGSNGKHFVKKGLILLVLVLAVIFAGMKFLSAKNGAAVKYITKPLERGDLTITVTATGNLEPINQVEVGSELSGIIETVHVDYNERVTEGQVLAVLDTSKLTAQVVKSRAALASARAMVLETEATIKEAQNALNRLVAVRARSGSKAVSEQDLDAAEASLARAEAAKAAAEASVAQAQAELDANETDLSKAEIRSPINGVVLIRSVEPGQTVAASLQAPVLFTLAESLTQMELHVDVDEADVGMVKEGQNAVFTVDAYPNLKFPAKIMQVRYGSETVDGVVTYDTLLHVDNSDLLLRPGMTATADIVVQEIRDALLAPNVALRFTPPAADAPEKEASGGSVLSKLFPRPPQRDEKPKTVEDAGKQSAVWVLRNGELASIPVTTGVTDGLKTEIKTGDVSPGLELVVDV
ncbi:MAG: efflux RND transporter periplasmic adaptor subunit, partial [Desulfococcus multivorans]|nr:efflux RND transporter periplasmic adaptor subunit [Desulfococcus multivorans]